MKFTKKNAFAIGAAVMMTAALATFASASTPAPSNIPVNVNENSVWVEAVDVDLSTMDFSQVLEGTPVAVGTIDPNTVNGGTTTAANGGLASVVETDVDVFAIDSTNVQEGELVAVAAIVNGSGTTQATGRGVPKGQNKPPCRQARGLVFRSRGRILPISVPEVRSTKKSSAILTSRPDAGWLKSLTLFSTVSVGGPQTAIERRGG